MPVTTLVVDASTLVAEALRARGQALLARPDLNPVAADEAWDETNYELRSRVARLVERGHLSAEEANNLLSDGLRALQENVARIGVERYVEHLAEASHRIARDPRDAPTVAVALALDAAILTGDRDFFGCGLPVWTTETLLHYLAWRDSQT